jgi:hypothetical protein
MFEGHDIEITSSNDKNHQAQSDILRDARFWYSVFASEFGSPGDELDASVLAPSFGVTEDSAFLWWESFTGSFEGVMDASDGYVEDPGRIGFDLANGITASVEYHPGGTFYRLHRGVDSALLGEVGPHWRLPGLRWDELAALADAAGQGTSSSRAECFLALLPLAWPISLTDIPAATDEVCAAIEALAVPGDVDGRPVAEAWARNVSSVVGVQWESGPSGAFTTSPNCTRNASLEPDLARALAELISAGSGRSTWRTEVVRWSLRDPRLRDLDREAARHLTSIGLPADINPFFRADNRETAQAGPADEDEWLRIGVDPDEAGEFVVSNASGAVIWRGFHAGLPHRFANSSVALFDAALRAVYAAWSVRPDLDDDAARAQAADLRERLLAIDAPCIEDSEGVWATVVEQFDSLLL